MHQITKQELLEFRKTRPIEYNMVKKTYKPYTSIKYALHLYVNGQGPLRCIVCNKRLYIDGKPRIHCFDCQYLQNRISYNEFIENYAIDRFTYEKWEGRISKSIKITIICPIHGNYKQCLQSAINGHGCQQCSFDDYKNRIKYTKEEWIESFVKSQGYFYDYAKIPIFIKTEDKITIICPIHGEFIQQANLHKTGHGCHQCGLNTIGEQNRYTTESFIERSNVIHNNIYDYSKTIYIAIREYVTITCIKHGDFEQIAYYHTAGNGCPKCYGKKENEWLDSLNIPRLRRRYKLIMRTGNIVYPDGYDEFTNTVYEFHGDFWHGNPRIFNGNDTNKINGKSFQELYENTLNKAKNYIENGFDLIEVWEDEWDKICLSNDKK